MPANDFEISKRAEKVYKLVAELDRLIRRCELDPQTDWPIVVSTISKWTDERWAALSVSAGTRPPSVVTRMMVIAALKARKKAA